MIDTSSQVPSPGAAAWLIDLRAERGVQFIVLRLTQAEARQTLAVHLLSIGAVTESDQAIELAGAGSIESVAVVW